MDGATKLLVYAIATVAIVSILTLVIFPMFPPAENNLAVLEKNLEASEVGLGVGFSSKIEVQQGDGFNGKTFESRTRNVIFQCNNASLCCPQGQECDLLIKWDSKTVQFNKTKTTISTTRCEKEYSIYTCTIYFGEKPAQIEIDSLKAPEEVDLGKNMPAFEISFSNTGGLEAIQTAVEIEIFRRYLEEGGWVEKRIESVSKVENFGSLAPNQTSNQTIYLNLNENGLFKARIRASGLEAGFDEKMVQFNTTGANTGCKALYCEEQQVVDEKCITRCHCDKCLFGSNCAEKLLQADNVTLQLNPEIVLEEGKFEILGSNLVDFEVPAQHCPEMEQGIGEDTEPQDYPDDAIPDPIISDPVISDPSDVQI